MAIKLSTYERVAIRHIGGKPPAGSRNRWVVYRTFCIDEGEKIISHIHAPMQIGKINWALNLDLGNIYDYCFAKTPTYRFYNKYK